MVARIDPEVAKQFMLDAGLIPLEPYKNSNAQWKCKCRRCGSLVSPRYEKIKAGQSGCKTCARKKIGDLKRFSNSQAVQIMLKSNLKPLEEYQGADKKWKCECLTCGKVSYPRLASVQKGTKCRSCSHIQRASKRKISQADALAVMRNADLKPLEPYENSSTRWKCECLKCGKIVYPRYISVSRGKGGCEFCGGNAKDPADAVAVMVKAGLEPLEPYKSAMVKWKCRHLVCGKVVYPRYSDVNSGKGGCNPCAKKKAIEWKKIPVEVAEKMMLDNGFQPLEPFKDTNTKWKCLCLKCGKVSTPRYSATAVGHGCIYCAKNKVDPEDAVAMMLNANLKPLVPYKTALTKWECQCLKCLKIVYPKYASIQSGQFGCRYCAEKGINMNNPSYLYLITHTLLNAHKVGMGNHKKNNDRLSRFIKEGWETYRVWETPTGGDAIDIEKEVFRVLRQELKIPIFLSKDDMPKTEGHTETVGADRISLPQLEKIVNKAYKAHLKRT
jgi:hypothetical protein